MQKDWDVVETTEPAAASQTGEAVAPLAAIAVGEWRALSERALEPNAYYLPGWELAVTAFARGRTGVSALVAETDASRLVGLMPVISLARAYNIPLPAFAS